MKKYYSTNKKYKKIKIYPLTYHLIKACAKPFIKKSETIFEVPIDRNEPVVFVSNHAMQYGPINMLYSFPYQNYRPWTTFKLCFFKYVPKHIMTDMLSQTKGIVRVLSKIVAFLLTPAIVYFFRAIESVPVYTAPQILTTFKKSIETLKEGKDLFIFPESPMVDETCHYCQKFHTGFTAFVDEYYRETGRKLKFYPMYVCQEHHKIMVGKPVEYNPDSNMLKKEQMRYMAEELHQRIEDLAAKLPPHKMIVYNSTNL